MSFDPRDFNDVADLAGAVQRQQQQKSLNEQNQLLREQNRLEKRTQEQNAQILQQLQEQRQKEDAEKKRLASLPSCPDCKSPVEVGSRRCKHCRIEIVSWDYAEQGLSWRLICRKSEAGALLQERSNFLVAEALRYKTLCIEICNRYDAKLIQRCCDGVATVSSIIARQKTQSSRDAISQCIANAINGKRVLASADEAAFDAARQEIIIAWRLLNQRLLSEVTIRQKQHDDTNKQLAQVNNDVAGCLGMLIGFGLWFAWFSMIIDAVERRQMSVAEWAGLPVAGVFCIVGPYVYGRLKRARFLHRVTTCANEVTAAKKRLNRCNSDKDEQIAHLNATIEAKASRYSDKLAKAGISPLVDELLNVRKSIVAAGVDLTKYSLELKRYYTAAVDLKSFASTCDNVSIATPARLDAVNVLRDVNCYMYCSDSNTDTNMGGVINAIKHDVTKLQGIAKALTGIDV